jgi:hypothetical protein
MAMVVGLTGPAARAELRPDKVHVADSKKTQAYIRDGLITGGDKAINEVVVKDIRRAANAGYERIVIDLEGTRGGEPAAIPRPPFYQISVTPDEKRIVVTIWGNPKLGFDSNRVIHAFKRSSVIQSLELMPRVEENTWTFVFGLKGESPVEVFELANPVRIIMDVKASARPATASGAEGEEGEAHPPKHAARAKPKHAPAKAKKAKRAKHAARSAPRPNARTESGLDGVPAEVPAETAEPQELHE